MTPRNSSFHPKASQTGIQLCDFICHKKLRLTNYNKVGSALYSTNMYHVILLCQVKNILYHSVKELVRALKIRDEEMEESWVHEVGFYAIPAWRDKTEGQWGTRYIPVPRHILRRVLILLLTPHQYPSITADEPLPGLAWPLLQCITSRSSSAGINSSGRASKSDALYHSVHWKFVRRLKKMLKYLNVFIFLEKKEENKKTFYAILLIKCKCDLYSLLK